MSSDWTGRFEPDRHTVALYRFDEGTAARRTTPAVTQP